MVTTGIDRRALSAERKALAASFDDARRQRPLVGDRVLGPLLNYLASAVVIGWGVAHIVPTREVVKSLGEVAIDSRRIMEMEWVAEGLALVFIGVSTFVLTVAAGLADPVAVLVYRMNAAALVVFAAWTYLAGFQTSLLPIKLCPAVLTAAATLVVIATLV
jgi:hypothetical protein